MQYAIFNPVNALKDFQLSYENFVCMLGTFYIFYVKTPKGQRILSLLEGDFCLTGSYAEGFRVKIGIKRNIFFSFRRPNAKLSQLCARNAAASKSFLRITDLIDKMISALLQSNPLQFFFPN